MLFVWMPLILLLGRPWQFDRRVLHDGFLNTYMFTFHGKRVTLLPLSPHEILQDTAERARLKAIEEATAKDTEASGGARRRDLTATAARRHPRIRIS